MAALEEESGTTFTFTQIIQHWSDLKRRKKPWVRRFFRKLFPRVCQKPDVKNGFINTIGTEFEVGSYLLVTCNEGFYLEKNKVKDNIQCTNNNWNPNPVCKEQPCGKPKGIENGRVISDEAEFKPGLHTIYECFDGYSLWPNAATCSLGKWQYPTCIDSSCGPPEAIEHGKVIRITSQNKKSQENTGKYFRGDQAEYQCDSTYTMKGNKFVTCENATWTKTPECSKIGASCGIPPSVNFGDTTETKKASYPSGSFITYVCRHLYTLDGNERIQCKDGKWEQEPVCREPYTVKESDMETNNIKLKYKPKEKKIYCPHADWLLFECLDGYGISDRTLLRTQCWDGKVRLPKCLKQGFCVLDRSIMNVNNIRYGNDDFFENGNVITFECADGLRAENTLEAKCINGEIIYPKCVSPEARSSTQSFQ
ncbi:complement factor H-related protein 1-like [Gastrophryne carolinensis]